MHAHAESVMCTSIRLTGEKTCCDMEIWHLQGITLQLDNPAVRLPADSRLHNNLLSARSEAMQGRG